MLAVKEFNSAENEKPWCVVDTEKVGSNDSELILGRFATSQRANEFVAIFREDPGVQE